ncbi:MAG: tetratricopeptide repeat protein, partial [Candidatus Omnitrophica bacterium]|nr:tetratricopeptide repeat protein [Candidatus Omnitrophota bacterium]
MKIESAEKTIWSKEANLYLCLFLIIFVGLAVYSSSLNGQFIWDDDVLVKNNSYIKDWSNVDKLFAGGISTYFSGGGLNFYRPLQMITYVADYSLWKLNIKGYHLTNILLHIGVALLLYFFINILFNDAFLSCLTSVFFISHPAHTEAVSYISGRSDSLSALFMILCFIFYIKALHANNMAFNVIAVLSYICAILSRETSLILPILFLLYHYVFQKKIKLKIFFLILVISFLYILFRLTILRSLLDSPAHSSAFLERLPGFFIALSNYIKILVFPCNLHMGYGAVLFDFRDIRVFFGLLILILSLVYALRVKKSSQLIFFSISWFFIALLPISNVYPINAYIAEHWLYVPSIGVFLLIANGLRCMYKQERFRYAAIFIIIGLLTLSSYFTIRQNEYWKDPVDFYNRTLKYVSGSNPLYLNLGMAYFNIGRKEEAISVYKKAIQINPNNADAYNN